MYQVKRKVKNWFRDKWNWLKTFNNPPVVTINQDLVAYEGGPPAVINHGRAILVVNGNVTLKPFNGTIELKEHIKSK